MYGNACLRERERNEKWDSSGINKAEGGGDSCHCCIFYQKALGKEAHFNKEGQQDLIRPMWSQLAMRRNKLRIHTHGRISEALCWVKEAKGERGPVARFYLHEILSKQINSRLRLEDGDWLGKEQGGTFGGDGSVLCLDRAGGCRGANIW